MKVEDVVGFLSLISNDIQVNEEDKLIPIVAIVHGNNLLRVKVYNSEKLEDRISVVYNFRFESKEQHFIPFKNENQLLHLVQGLLDIEEMTIELDDENNGI